MRGCTVCIFRLVSDEVRIWTEDLIDSLASEALFDAFEILRKALKKPIFFSPWLSRRYNAVDQTNYKTTSANFLIKVKRSFFQKYLLLFLGLFQARRHFSRALRRASQPSAQD